MKILVPILMICTSMSLFSQIYWEDMGGPGTNISYIASTSDNVLIAGTPLNKVYRSTDRGQSWEVSADFPFDCNVNRIAVGKDDILFLAASRGTTEGGIYKSTDKGVTWQDITGDLPSRNIKAVDCRPNASGKNTVYIGIDDPIARIVTTYISDDDGASWSNVKIPNVQISALFETAISPTSGKLFISVAYNKGFYRSSDRGQQWMRIDQPVGAESDDNFRHIKFNRQGVAYLGRNALANSGISKNAIIMRSTDDCESWEPLTNGWNNDNIVNNRISGIAFGKNNEVFASTEKSGSFFSADGGTTWTSRVEGLPGDGSATAIGSTADGETVLIAAGSSGVQRFARGGVSSVTEAPAFPAVVGLPTPNPATDLIRLPLTSKEPQVLSAVLVDSRGVQVYSITELIPAGSSMVSIETSNLMSGVYTWRLMVNGAIRSGSVVLVR
jgi:Sortilin, neurotensin receptor 3,